MKKIIGILMISFFSLSFFTQAQITEDAPLDGVFLRENAIDKKPVTYQYVREADVMWGKRIWRVIDFREKRNQMFYYPEVPHENWKNLMTVIMDGLESGDITAYDATSSADEFTTPLNYGEVMSKFESSTTQRLQRPYPPYDWYDTVIVKSFNSTDVKNIRIKEDWFFDKQRSQMDVRIIGICPVRESYTESGEFRGFEPLFWIYFPHARKLFAKTLVFNEHNSAQRLTYDDVFWKRIFSSYIYKADNVYDRKIAEYEKGVNSLLEAQRIKEDLFEFEENLWEY